MTEREARFGYSTTFIAFPKFCNILMVQFKLRPEQFFLLEWWTLHLQDAHRIEFRLLLQIRLQIGKIRHLVSEMWGGGGGGGGGRRKKT